MTIEEEIRQVASSYAIDEVKDTCNPASKRGLLFSGFIDGAEWADSHPLWISVEEDLPPYGEQVLAFAEEDPDYEMWWSERYTPEGAKYKGVSSGKVYEIMTDRNGFASMRDENNEPLQVSHWRRIVPPKHSNSENIGKNLKGE